MYTNKMGFKKWTISYIMLKNLWERDHECVSYFCAAVTKCLTETTKGEKVFFGSCLQRVSLWMLGSIHLGRTSRQWECVAEAILDFLVDRKQTEGRHWELSNVYRKPPVTYFFPLSSISPSFHNFPKQRLQLGIKGPTNEPVRTLQFQIVTMSFYMWSSH
jgi:hypothetical protein